jgi:hypothetical protein
MPLITLTSDMGTQDHYVAVVKAAIYQHLPVATVIDISHHVRPFDVGHAAFLMRGCFKDFPKGTVHIMGVNQTARQFATIWPYCLMGNILSEPTTDFSPLFLASFRKKWST